MSRTGRWEPKSGAAGPQMGKLCSLSARLGEDQASRVSVHEPGSLAKPRVVTHVENTMCQWRKMKVSHVPRPSALATSCSLLSCVGLER